MSENFDNNIENIDINYLGDSYSTPSIEIIDYLRKKLQLKINEYEDIIRKKNEHINELNSQIEALKKRISEIEEIHKKTEEELFSQNKELFLKLNKSREILNQQKEKHQKEIKLLKEIFDRTKLELNTLSETVKELRTEKEKLKKENLELLKEKQNFEFKLKQLENQLSESKKAVNETLTQLLDERKITQELNRKIRELENTNKDLKKQLEETKLAWDSERQQWKELWERERSVWETHRQEFAIWEERLRSEREAWLSKLKTEEEKGVDYASKLARVLEDASKWSSKINEIMKFYANKGVVLPHVVTGIETVEKKVKSGFRKVFAVGFALLLFIISSFWFINDYRSKIHYTVVSSEILDDSNYTGVVKYDDYFVFSHWDKGLIFKDKNLKTVKEISTFEDRKLKISAIDKAGKHFWLLDLSNLRFVETDDTGKVYRFYKTISVAPQGVSYDGMYIWSFDASTKLLYRYSVNGEIQGVSGHDLDGIKNVDWLDWVGGKLYVLSNGYLYRFDYRNDRFYKISKQKTKNFVYCNVDKENMYVIRNKDNFKLFEIYRTKSRS